jgi:hypothetical protein
MSKKLPTDETYDTAYKSIAPITLKNRGYPDYPFMSGTGFFVQCPPYENIFFVTAKHCVLDDTVLQVSYVSKGIEAVDFSASFTTQAIDDDIVVYVVSDEISDEQKNLLKNKSLILVNPDVVNLMLKIIIEHNQNIRAMGFPSVSKEIDYDNKESFSMARLFYGKVSNGESCNLYKIENLNWGDKGGKDGLSGFSGSPVFALCPDLTDTVTVLLGVLITGSPKMARFISINVVTNLIAEYMALYR